MHEFLHSQIGMLACRHHWYLLPRPLREAILIAFRGGNRRAYVGHVREAERVWQEFGVWPGHPVAEDASWFLPGGWPPTPRRVVKDTGQRQ